MTAPLITLPKTAVVGATFLVDQFGNPISSSNPILAGSAGASVAVTPAVTAGAYTAGFGVGGILTFTNALSPNFSGLLESLTLSFAASLQTGEYDLSVFLASPFNGVYADHATPTWSGLDSPLMIGQYALLSPSSVLGTQTIYNLDSIGKWIFSTTQNLYGVLTAKSGTTNNLPSVSDVTARMGVIW